MNAGQKALEDALAHPWMLVSTYVRIFHGGTCGGIIDGTALRGYRCEECGGTFTVDQLRAIVGEAGSSETGIGVFRKLT